MSWAKDNESVRNRYAWQSEFSWKASAGWQVSVIIENRPRGFQQTTTAQYLSLRFWRIEELDASRFTPPWMRGSWSPRPIDYSLHSMVFAGWCQTSWSFALVLSFISTSHWWQCVIEKCDSKLQFIPQNSVNCFMFAVVTQRACCEVGDEVWSANYFVSAV
jgi:hypothetical protein